MWKFAQINTLNYCIVHPLGCPKGDGEISRKYHEQRQRQRERERQRQQIQRPTFRGRNLGWGDGFFGGGIRGRAGTRKELGDFPLVNQSRKKQWQRHTLDLFRLCRRRVFLWRRYCLVQFWDMYGFALFFSVGNICPKNRHFVHDSVFVYHAVSLSHTSDKHCSPKMFKNKHIQKKKNYGNKFFLLLGGMVRY